MSSVSPIYANSGNTPHLLQQIEQLRIENMELKTNNHEILKKVAKVSILEQEMSKIHQAYQALLKHSEKRELLEKSARSKLQAVILSLSEANKVSYITSVFLVCLWKYNLVKNVNHFYPLFLCEHIGGYRAA